MSDGTRGSSSPTSNSPTTSSSRGSARAPAKQNRPSAAPAGGSPQAPGALLIIGGLVLIALFGLIAFFAGRGAATGSSDVQQTTIDVIKTVSPSVVEVQGRGNGPGSSVGSGEIVTSSGYIVTNSHVVHGRPSLTVRLSTGATTPAQLVADKPAQDLALLKISASDLQPIAVADSSQVQVGQSDIAMGSPLGLEQSATTGIVSALNREGREQVDGNIYTLTGMIQTSAPINPGNSGGALVNLQGQLIGIPTLSAVDPTTGAAANGIGFAITSNQMEAFVKPYIPAGG